MDADPERTAREPPYEELPRWADKIRPLRREPKDVSEMRLADREEDPLPLRRLPTPPVPEEVYSSRREQQAQHTSGRKQRHDAVEDLFNKLMEQRRELLKQWHQLRRGPILKDALADRIFTLLLEAWTRRLGYRTPDGYTRYSRKTSTRACLTLRELMKNGDPDTKMPIAKYATPMKWEKYFGSVKWWFDTAEDAIDFLSSLGRGNTRFGQQEVRVDAAKYLDRATRKCIDPDHNRAMSDYYFMVSGVSYNPKPSVDPCACVDQIRLLQILANRQGINHVDLPNVLHKYERRVMELWVRANQGAGVEAGTRPFMAKGTDGRVFGMQYWEKVMEEGEGEGEMLVVGRRVEGPLAELL